MTLRDKLFSFDGRLRRRDWWIYTISSSLVFVALASLFALATGGFVRNSSWYLTASFGDPLQQLLPSIALYAPLVFIQTTLAVKRAHDRNQSARLVIGLVLATAVLSFMPDDGLATLGRMVDEGALWAGLVMAAAVVGKASSLYLFVVLGLLDGTPGPNRFGPSPKGRSGGVPLFTTPGGLE